MTINRFEFIGSCIDYCQQRVGKVVVKRESPGSYRVTVGGRSYIVKGSAHNAMAIARALGGA